MIRLLFVFLLLFPSVSASEDCDSYPLGVYPGAAYTVVSINETTYSITSLFQTWSTGCTSNTGTYYNNYNDGIHWTGSKLEYAPSFTESGCGAGWGKFLNIKTYNVDSVGSCTVPPLEPASCSDGVKSENESGIDCGDPLCVDGDSVCSVYCPVGFHSESRPLDYIESCYSDDSNSDYYTLAKLGQCPDGMFKSITDSELCISWVFPTYASGDFLDTVESPTADSTPWNNVTTDELTTVYNTVALDNGITTEINSETIESTSSDGLASEQITTETTVTQVDGSSVTTNVVETNSLNSSGYVTGQTVTTVSTYDPSGVLLGSTSATDVVESSFGAGDSFQAPSSGVFEVDQELFDSFTDRYELFYFEIENAPIYTPVANLFSGPDTSAKSADFSLAMGSYGTKSFALSTYDQVWNALGVLFIFMATLTTARMIMVRGFSGGN